jgi:hypothetical protein
MINVHLANELSSILATMQYTLMYIDKYLYYLIIRTWVVIIRR